MKNHENFGKEQPSFALAVDLTEEELQGINGGDDASDLEEASAALQAAMDAANANRDSN